MSKINVIIGKEYLTRIRKKSFVIVTFLVPVLFVLMSIIPAWLMSMEDTTAKKIIVVDKTGLYKDAFVDDHVQTFIFSDKTLEELRAESSDFTALLLIEDDLAQNPAAATLYSEKQLNVELKLQLSKILSQKVEEQKLEQHNIPGLKEIIQESKTNLSLGTIKWGIDGEEQQTFAELALVIGMGCAFLIYFFIVIYGTQVMNGVVQEKSNRIVEVIISSVRPFELMMGKILGIALVALTQFVMWIVLTFILMSIGSFIFAGSLDISSIKEMAQMGQVGGVDLPMSEAQQTIDEIHKMLSSFNWGQILSLFVVYFLGGYLLYASLFAAVGSAIDNETDAGQFTMPIMLPILVAFFSAFYVIKSPDSAFAFWASIFPLTSPIVMLVRLPFDVPTWQIVLSIGLLILSFIGTTWLASKIYKTGILLYGKKFSWKDMWKWLSY